MATRFHKSKKILPGVKVNLNKKSASITIGPKWLHKTYSTTGRTTTTVSAPGTGLSYSQSTSAKKKEPAPATDPVLIAEQRRAKYEENMAALAGRSEKPPKIVAALCGVAGALSLILGSIFWGIFFLALCGLFTLSASQIRKAKRAAEQNMEMTDDEKAE